MKHKYFTIILFLTVTLTMNAQDTASSTSGQETFKNALGLRMGIDNGFAADLSYQVAIGSLNNRLEADLGFRNGDNYNGIKIAGIFQWYWELDENLNWYAGAGGGFGSYKQDGEEVEDTTLFNADDFLFLAGDVGIEYKFDSPLILSLNIRPEVGLSKDTDDDFSVDMGIGLRYQF